MLTLNRFQYDFGSDLLSQVGGTISSGLTGGLGNIMGLPVQALGNMMQVSEQQQLTNQQEQANEKFAAFGEGLQKDMWNYTNYENQVKHIEAAGLNPAILYAKGGMGGTTGQVSAPAGMGIAPGGQAASGMQAAQAAADVHLKEAQAHQIEATTPGAAGLQEAQTQSLTQGVENQKAAQALTQAQTTAQNNANQIQNATIEDQIASIRAAASKVQQDYEIIQRNNWMDAQTLQDKIALVHGQMIGQFVNNNLQRTETTNIAQQTQQSIQQIAQQWQALKINKQNANTQEGQLKIQQFVNDISHGQTEIIHALTRLIPNIIL